MEYNGPFDMATFTTSHDESTHFTNTNGIVNGQNICGEALEYPQREILNVIKAASLTPTNQDLGQLYQAIEALINQKLARPLGGKIITFAPTTIPGYAYCNGAAIPDDPKYDAYKTWAAKVTSTHPNITTTHWPDVRGTFDRMIDDGKGLDTGRAAGSYQADAIQNITGDFMFSIRGCSIGGGQSGAIASYRTGGNPLQDESNDGACGGPWGFNFWAARVVPTAAEVRVKNYPYYAYICWDGVDMS